MNHTLKTGQEVRGNYGECNSVSCPHCGNRQYPQAEAGTVARCITCEGLFRLPDGYGVQQPAIKGKGGLLPADLKEAGYTLQVENHNTAILYLDGKEIAHWYRSQTELTLEQIHAEIRALTDYNTLIRKHDTNLREASRC